MKPSDGNTAHVTVPDPIPVTLPSPAPERHTVGSALCSRPATHYEITRNAQNEITYINTSDSKSEVIYNTVRTRAGGVISLLLDDGSKVWVNAKSEFTYPISFSNGSREVELNGEAYFIIKKSTAPFRVISKEQTVEVLGTQFNVSAYEDEPYILTTLVEGQVLVGTGDQSERLLPGEQTVLSAQGLAKRAVDIRSFTAWRDGYFSLESKSLAQLMKEVSRWYNIGIRYEGAIPSVIFYGDASRDSELKVILRLLEEAGVRYRMEGRELTITGKR